MWETQQTKASELTCGDGFYQLHYPAYITLSQTYVKNLPPFVPVLSHLYQTGNDTTRLGGLCTNPACVIACGNNDDGGSVLVQRSKQVNKQASKRWTRT